MTEPEPAPIFSGAITVTATAHAVHPDGADLSELPDPDRGHDTNETTELH